MMDSRQTSDIVGNIDSVHAHQDHDAPLLWLIRTPRYSGLRLSRNALPMTDTELKLIAAAAMMGLRNIPKNG